MHHVKIAYVTSYDADDVRNWSGLGFFIRKALIDAGLEVETMRPRASRFSPGITARRVFSGRARGQGYLWSRDPALLRRQADDIARQLAGSDVDVVFSPGTLPIAYLDEARPIVFWADATFDLMLDLYPGFINLTSASKAAGTRADAGALARASLALYASDWAARSARETYGASPGKVEVVPFGANLHEAIEPSLVARLISERPRDVCRLLFVGVDWTRKGGDLAVKVTQELNAGGLPTVLTVAGCEPDIPADLRRIVDVRGFVDKSTEWGRAELQSLFAESHFLILPSEAECYGLVLCEANAYGVPCLASSVGGIPTIIRNGVNGRLFDDRNDGSSFAQFVLSVFGDHVRYQALAHTSYEEYRARLNWQVSGARVRELLEGLTVSADARGCLASGKRS
jgi:glycosyltransferase involved in cell wall biosynthesis